jgi:hypothetical protein
VLIDEILFNPGNRLLGSSPGDMSYYGGQASPGIALRPAAEDSRLPEEAPNSPATVSAAAAPASVASAPVAEQAQAGPVEAMGAPAAAAPAFHLASIADGASPFTSDTIYGAPAATGAGSLVPAGPFGHGMAEGPQSFLAHSGDGAAQVSDLAQTAIAPAPLGELGTPLTDLGHGLAGVTEVMPGLVAPVLDGAGSLVSTTLDSVGHAVPELLDTTGTLVATTLDSVDHAVVSPLLDTTGDLVTATVGAVGETLDGLAGNDPAGGIATLVSLVSVTDLFDLHPVDAPVADEGDLGLGLVDALADGGLSETLLGDHHDGSDLGLDHLTDHHALGL